MEHTIKETIEENTKLKEENKELLKRLVELVATIDGLDKENAKLLEYSKKLTMKSVTEGSKW